MKKIVTSVMVLALILSMGLSVFAAPGGFLVSPGTKPTPTLLEGAISDCDGELVVTPYSERHNLPDDERELLEDAYDQIRANKDLSKLCPELEEIAKTNKHNVKRYAVKELFNVGYKGCEDHDDHDDYRAVLKPESTKNFVALLTLVDGKWIVVEDVKVDGDHLIVNGAYYGPYAMVVNTGSGATGDNFPWIYVVLMAVSAAGLVALAVVYKKRKAA